MNAGSHDDRDRLIDRLVDGALPEPDRQRLLAALDGDGWRRCALAFLEAQAWREALGPVARAGGPVEVGSGSARQGFRGLARLAMAAGVIGAFALGWLARGGAGGVGTPAPAPVAAPLAVRSPAAVPPAVVKAPEPAAEPTPAPAAENLVDNRPAPAPLSDAVLDDWASQGYQVERRQRVISLGFDDGQRVPVPVSEVRLRYVGDRTY